MPRKFLYILIFLAISWPSVQYAQDEKPIRIFGYFQNQFKQEGDPNSDRNQNSFLLQQLNLFFQKGIAKRWSAFVNFELINSYSSARQWGSFRVEEAWVKYRASKKFQLKMGLLIPTFNHLNAIKNRTPLLPYVTRPLVYEASLDFIPLDEFIPSRAFVQAYGVIPGETVKFDYAAYLGNSPNISTQTDGGQSGVDTTSTFLIGGRAGVRVFNNIKAGISLTHDKDNVFDRRFPNAPFDLEGLRRLRLGADLSFQVQNFFFEGEYIDVEYDERTNLIELDKKFYYGTIGWRPIDALVIYGSYWRTRSHDNVRPANRQEEGNQSLQDIEPFISIVESSSAGLAYTMHERIVLKGQYVRVSRETDNPRVPPGRGFNIYNAAISVSF